MSTASRERRVMDLLGRALELEGEGRQRFIALECADNPQLREELEALLAEESAVDDGFLEVPAAEALTLTSAEGPSRRATAGAGTSSQPPDRLGPYRIVEKLGSGGMGSVFRAEQEKPVRRKVALKVIDAVHDAKQRKRFAAESQALARLSHPNVASLYEAGTTEDGHPFVAMELIEGSSITSWCDQRKLDLAARIELFAGACAGVRHAHSQGILHRDLKPSNVLVTEVDGRPVAKVIDFGIARALGEESLLSSDTNMTLEHQIIGSPAYMSPEAVIQRNVDARSDVYSLGLILYQLLVGVPPSDIDKQSVSDLLRRLVEAKELPLPSARFAELDDDRRKRIAAHRGTSPEGLLRLVRGDLDAIAQKALMRDPDSRYGSPSDLAVDLQSHLASRPVEVRTRSAAYVFGKFVQRHRLAVAAAALLALALVTGIVATSTAMVRAKRAEARALADVARAQQLVDDFFLAVSENRLVPAAGDAVRTQLLERALHYYEDFIEQRTEDDSLRPELTRAYVRVGRIYGELGMSVQSQAAFARAREMLRASLPNATHEDLEARLRDLRRLPPARD